ncbi:sensor domain-containing phosphodiesterase [Algirhabdus cladophorae]|uniref:sensor domain-containing phosphodiesterase n=1 Tax=Algirhabdus cladophorae TaxID=3377108 RepID=UPI003B84B5D5
MSNVPEIALSRAADGLLTDDTITNALSFVRQHLDMDVAYLSEFVGDNLVFRAVDAPGFEELVHVDGQIPLDQVYCRHILEGNLPELMRNTLDFPLADQIPVTHSAHVRSHVSVPVRKRDGTPYGMFCCLSQQTRPTLNDRDLEVVRVFANLSADHINQVLDKTVKNTAIEDRLNETIVKSLFKIVYQPIFDISSRFPSGFEALTRFEGEPYRPPNVWFDEAYSVEMQADLEIATIERALDGLLVLPDDVYLSVNASPETVQSGRLDAVFAGHDCSRIVLEVTEHAVVEDYHLLLSELQLLRERGIRLAVDDAGAGYSGLQHIVQLQPDIIKLDISLTAKIDRDVVRKSLGSALVRFAKETGARIVAEGIETEAEFATLCKLGVDLGQGYLLGKPDTLENACLWFQFAGAQKA